MKYEKQYLFVNLAQNINDIIAFIDKHGPKGAKKIIFDNEMNDKLISTLFVYGIRKYENHNWYLKKKKNESPDFETLKFIGGEYPFKIIRGEITSIPNFILNETDKKQYIRKIINKKLLKRYEPNTCLLFFLNNEIPKYCMDFIVQYISENPNKWREARYSSAWIIYLNEITKKSSFIYTIGQLIPFNENNIFIKVRILEERFKKYHEPSGIRKHAKYIKVSNQ